MKIERVELAGFARLRGLDLTFSDTVNVIAGPNEAGKSTLAEALQALLFGLTESADSRAPTKTLARFRPWAGGTFSGTLHVCRQCGEQYRIFRDFENGETKLYRDPGATDETSYYAPGRHGWIDFAARHLGMSATVFRACGWIDQAALQPDKSQVTTLKGKLESLTDAPGSEASAQTALARLRDWLRVRINPDAHAIANSPYLTAKAAVERLRAELATSRATLAGLEGLAVDERASAAKLLGHQQELTDLERLLARRDFDALDARCQRLQTIDARLATVESRLAELADIASLSSGDFEAAVDALARAEHLDADVAANAGTVEQERPASEKVRRELAETEAALAGLPSVSTAAIAAADEAVRAWELADQAKATLSEIERRDDRLKQPASPAAGAWSAAFVITLSAVIGGVLGYLALGLPGAGAGGVMLGALGFLAARLLRSRDNVASARIAKSHAAPRTDLERADANLTASRQAARDVLASLGQDVATPSDARVVIAKQREAHNHRGVLLQRQAEFVGRQRGYTEHVDRLDSLKRERTAAQTTVGERLRAIGIATPVSDPRGAFDGRRHRYREYQAATGDAALLRSSRASLIGNENPDEWQPRREALRERADGADPRDRRSREDLERRRDTIASERDDGQEKVRALRQRHESALSGLRPPAAIEEDLAEAERELGRMERLKAALDDAWSLLNTAAADFRRDFAPRLASGIDGDLARITAGRYREVEVDPTSLTVRVKSAERTDLVALDNLSHGTRDAIYVLLRATVAQLLSGSGEPVPLFLDDPLVHVDHDRAIRLLDVFGQLGKRWQIFYFTQDERVVTWAKNCPHARVHDLALGH